MVKELLKKMAGGSYWRLQLLRMGERWGRPRLRLRLRWQLTLQRVRGCIIGWSLQIF